VSAILEAKDAEDEGAEEWLLGCLALAICWYSALLTTVVELDGAVVGGNNCLAAERGEDTLEQVTTAAEPAEGLAVTAVVDEGNLGPG
jgi:hypothetical protein